MRTHALTHSNTTHSVTQLTTQQGAGGGWLPAVCFCNVLNGLAQVREACVCVCARLCVYVCA